MLLKGTVMLNHMTEVKVAVFVANTVQLVNRHLEVSGYPTLLNCIKED
jgi:hypothetical protein